MAPPTPVKGTPICWSSDPIAERPLCHPFDSPAYSEVAPAFAKASAGKQDEPDYPLQCAEPFSHQQQQEYLHLTQTDHPKNGITGRQVNSTGDKASNSEGTAFDLLGPGAMVASALAGSPVGWGLFGLGLAFSATGCGDLVDRGQPPDVGQPDAGQLDTVPPDVGQPDAGQPLVDGQPDAGQPIEGDEDGDGYRAQELGGEDCDDTNAVVHPGAEEICNEIDDDCDGDTDEGVQISFYRDDDGDGYGISEGAVLACTAPPRHVEIDGDCNDEDNTIHPAATEVRDGIDNDCDGVTDEKFWLQVSVGRWHTCGLKTNNTVECWGDNRDGQCNAPEGSFTQISVGESHSCGLRTDQTVECWGDTLFGAPTPPLGTFNQVSASSFSHTCGVRTDETVECWGSNRYGESSPPEGSFSQISVGGFHTCGVKTDGRLQCWGYDSEGQSNAPEGSFRQVSAGSVNTCGLRTDKTVECWGNNDFDGQSNAPEGTFNQVSTSGGHTCGVTTDGVVKCWGWNTHGQSDAPEGTFTQISAGWFHTCGVRTDGNIQCWGSNFDGESTPPGQ